MPDGSRRLSEVIEELVRRGVPRCDDHCRANGPYWWLVHPHELPDYPPGPKPRTVLGYASPSGADDKFGLHDVQLSISTCECCDAIVRTEFIDSHGATFGAIPFWPGFESAEFLWTQLRLDWEAEMERFMESER